MDSLIANLAGINATFNAISGAFLFSGWAAIRSGRRDLHKKAMLAAVGASALFLTGYLTRVATTGPKKFPGAGAARGVYLTILTTHTLLAMVVLPLVIRTLWLAFHDRIAEHKRLVKWTFPIWAYVSVTGVVVYVMLYRVAW